MLGRHVARYECPPASHLGKCLSWLPCSEDADLSFPFLPSSAEEFDFILSLEEKEPS